LSPSGDNEWKVALIIYREDGENRAKRSTVMAERRRRRIAWREILLCWNEEK